MKWRKSRFTVEEFKRYKREQARASYRKHAEKRRASARAKRAELRAEFLAAYGGKCTCCGESEKAFLTLEHVNRDGKAHRKKLSGTNSWSEAVFRDLKRRGWPKKGYTILCFNCNHASWKLGTCPHKKSEQ